MYPAPELSVTGGRGWRPAELSSGPMQAREGPAVTGEALLYLGGLQNP